MIHLVNRLVVSSNRKKTRNVNVALSNVTFSIIKNKTRKNSQYLAMSDKTEVVLLAPHAVLNEAVSGNGNLQKIK